MILAKGPASWRNTRVRSFMKIQVAAVHESWTTSFHEYLRVNKINYRILNSYESTNDRMRSIERERGPKCFCS
jgi:hypothetical protein